MLITNYHYCSTQKLRDTYLYLKKGDAVPPGDNSSDALTRNVLTHRIGSNLGVQGKVVLSMRLA